MHMQLRDALSEWHQLYSGGVYPPMHGRPQSKFEENNFSHSQDTHKLANFCKKFLFFFFFAISHTLQKFL